ncbi:olfactory receptor 6N2-like [Hemicordylus capensis]|uniref:olfactory receptor 6N2-like n=1 Tax=Hemicordylus capensis TaxID=884348 RepID=UPI00230281A6|nr:olfactory receptor 6N2-like [Hemicordylus capensis]
MEATNETMVTEFELVGFRDLQNFHTLLFVILLLIYLFILSGNTIILSLIQTCPRFHIPMYFFIAVLAVLEMCYTTVTIPKMLADVLQRKNRISFSGCLLQIYFFHALGITEACLLTVMAYDRYLAICTPLNYPTTMTTKHCFKLVVGCYACGFACPLPEIILLSRLPFCGTTHIKHIFCDFPPVFSLICFDTSTIIMIDFIIHSFVILGPVFLIVLSYIKILAVVSKIQSLEGRQKAFSTCASHLIVVFAFFGTTGFMYVRLSQARSLFYERIIAVIYAVLTPLFNPIVYTLRNKDIQEEIRKMIKLPDVPLQAWRHIGY